ncbi:MAG: divalent-cation tolerance protein CutA [Burkholderiaceae bacterium]|jgi:periplasmic divalent cation tolerance protein|nr:divalent-cation tolerance protein CutA [Burkholderiaceae bacterium]MDH5209736.1 divalent-cation tolerance protein CutA [Burkholderiaceae bacterium]
MSEPLLVLTNCPDDGIADRIARSLVESGLAACVNRLAPVASVYRWQGVVERDTETPLLIKTTRGRYAEVEQAIRALHPYEVPEIIALAIDGGFAPYLQWIGDETEPPLVA